MNIARLLDPPELLSVVRHRSAPPLGARSIRCCSGRNGFVACIILWHVPSPQGLNMSMKQTAPEFTNMFKPCGLGTCHVAFQNHSSLNRRVFNTPTLSVSSERKASFETNRF